MAHDVKVNIKGDANEFKLACKEAEAAAAKTKQKLQQDAGQAAGKIGGKLGAGGLSGGVLGIAATGAMAIGTKAIQMYTQAQQDAADALKRNATEAGYATEQEAKRATAIISTTNAIAQLNAAEQNSNVNKEKALQLLQQMQRRYNGLTVAIDKNGRVTEESLKAAQKLAIQRQAKSVADEMNENSRIAAHYNSMANDPINVLNGKNVEYAIQADEYINKNRKLALTLKELNVQLKEVDINFENRKRMFAAQEKDVVDQTAKKNQRAIDRLTLTDNAGMRDRVAEDAVEAGRQAAGGHLSAANAQAIADSARKLYDQQQQENNNRKILSLQDELRAKQLELSGKTKEAELLRKVSAEQQRLGRVLTPQEYAILKGQVAASVGFNQIQNQMKRADLGRPNIANPWTTDNLIQMGEKVNIAAVINYPAKTLTSVQQIQIITEKIFASLDKAEGSVFP